MKSALRSLTSASATKLYIENGSTVSSQFSVCNDPTVAHGRPIIPFVDRLARRRQIQAWPPPAVRELNDPVRILGEEIHTMLLRNKLPRAALRDAQARCDRVMPAGGTDRSVGERHRPASARGLAAGQRDSQRGVAVLGFAEGVISSSGDTIPHRPR